jgi:hypothetical protein
MSLRVKIDCGLKFDCRLYYLIPAIPSRAIIHWDSSFCEGKKIICTTGWIPCINNDLIKFSKCSHFSKTLASCLDINFSPTFIFHFVRFKLFHFHQILKKKGLNGKIDNMSITPNPLTCGISFDILLFEEISLNRTIKSIVCYCIIWNNNTNDSCNAVILKYGK